MNDYAAGDLVYYEYQAGWGGGAKRQAVAVVLGVTDKMVRIALVNEKHATSEVVEKVVSPGKLTKREGKSKWDFRLSVYRIAKGEVQMNGHDAGGRRSDTTDWPAFPLTESHLCYGVAMVDSGSSRLYSTYPRVIATTGDPCDELDNEDANDDDK